MVLITSKNIFLREKELEHIHVNQYNRIIHLHKHAHINYKNKMKNKAFIYLFHRHVLSPISVLGTLMPGDR